MGNAIIFNTENGKVILQVVVSRSKFPSFSRKDFLPFFGDPLASEQRLHTNRIFLSPPGEPRKG